MKQCMFFALIGLIASASAGPMSAKGETHSEKEEQEEPSRVEDRSALKNNDVILSIEPIYEVGESHFRGGEAVQIAMIISNRSDKTFTYYDSHGAQDVEFSPSVQTVDGNDVGRTS